MFETYVVPLGTNLALALLIFFAGRWAARGIMGW